MSAEHEEPTKQPPSRPTPAPGTGAGAKRRTADPETEPATALLQMDGTLFDELIGELARRGQGRREAGAFLLAAADAGPDRPTQISAVAYYDDLDPHSLTGGIAFGASGYSALNALCRQRSLRVAGDIHTHPRTFIAQSGIDSTHPMVGLRGHVALISPNYGQGQISPADLGVHLYTGGEWTSYFGADAAIALRMTGRPSLLARMRRSVIAARSAALVQRARTAGAHLVRKLFGRSPRRDRKRQQR